MVSGTTIRRRYRRLSAINIFTALVLSVVCALVAGNLADDAMRVRLHAAANETLAVQTEALVGLLDTHRLLPALLSHRPDVQELFVRRDDPAAQDEARRIAARAVGYSGAMEVTFLYPDGTLMTDGVGAAQDRIDPDSSLISVALEGRLGREIRTLDNGKRAYVFTSAVRKDGRNVGIIAVYVSIEEVESTWSLSTNPIIAVDSGNQIVISNRPEWRQEPLATILPDEAGSFRATRGRKVIDYLAVSRDLPLLGWTLYVLTDLAPARAAGAFWAALTALGCIAIAVTAQALINRQNANEQRTRRNRATSLRLERIVRDRTKALIQTNATLEDEIEERREANRQLQKAQNELIQTGKLAALGQMSTALAHEYNQPLSAVKSYAENALTYLERKRIPEAAENIRLISELTDRMAEISRHLKNFARRPNPTYAAVPVDKVVADSLSVAASRIRSDGADVDTTGVAPNLWVRAGHVRLQQVLVNLVLNALDAMQGQPRPTITIAATLMGGRVNLTVADKGRGIAPDVIDQIFDPFFTTKEVGRGLGLGLSISYNIIKDFGGQLSAANQPEGGALFTISLEEGGKNREAAE